MKAKLPHSIPNNRKVLKNDTIVHSYDIAGNHLLPGSPIPLSHSELNFYFQNSIITTYGSFRKRKDK